MRKQAGQALILVLILLAIGALLVVPSLRLTGTALMNSPIVERQIKGLYAADAATEYILWKLAYDEWGKEFDSENPEAGLNFYVCEVPVSVYVVMRATEGKGGITLATEHVIKPTKTVAVEGHPEWSNPDDGSVQVDNGYSGPYTYIIKMEQLSNDNSKGLDSIYDVLPKGLEYEGPSWIRVDGGEWVDFPDPLSETKNAGGAAFGGQIRLRWPDSGFFGEEMRHFDVREVKEIKFQATGSLANDTANYNWVLLNVEDVDTLSGPIAPIKLGAGTKPVGGLLTVSKKSYPEIIQPGVETTIRYEIKITNLDGNEHQIQSLTDYLPPGFDYCTTQPDPEVPPEPEPYAITHETCQLPYGITTSNPTEIVKMDMDTPDDPDDDRYRLYWEFSPPVSIPSYDDEEDILYLNFYARATKDISGSYYNEVIVEPDSSILDIFQPPDMTVEKADLNNSSYSWNTGTVFVPAYDTSSESEGITIDANMALIPGGITITSWGVY